MKKMLLLILMFSGCSTVQKNTSADYLAAYQQKEALSSSLLDNEGKIDEEGIQKILQSKVKLPQKIHMAILFFSENNQQGFLSPRSEKLFQLESWGPQIQAISPLPQLLIGERANLLTLRRAAALLQADVLLVMRPITQTDSRNFLFRAEAKAVSTVEVLLLDVRSSVVLFSAISTGTVQLERAEDDYSHREMLERTKAEGEFQAQERVPDLVKAYLASLAD
jgi:hypothetical protein